MRSDHNRDSSDTPVSPPTSPTNPAPLPDGATADAESLLLLLQRAASPTLAVAVGAPPSAFPCVPGYEIECELGRGGMGVVYKALHVALNRTVALKMILTSDHIPAGEVGRFRAEAEAVAAITHRNVVRVYDLCPLVCDRPYFTMEYIEGGSLAKLLKARKTLEPKEAAQLVAAVADGLQAAHDEGIVHRDIKPANILLSAESKTPELKPDERAEPRSALVPKVSDFGLAKRLASDVTRTQGMKGTPAYMAPEQASGKAKFVGPGADVYALGAVLYECLTGKPPFDGPDHWAIMQQAQESAPVSPRVAAPAVPRDLELICLKCLEKEPQDRYLSAEALASDLRLFLDGKPVSVRPVGTVSRAARWAKRRPAAAALVALVAALLFVVPPLVVWAQGRFDQRTAETAAANAIAAVANALADAAREREAAAEARTTAARAIAKAAQDTAELEKRERVQADKAAAAAKELAAARELFGIQNLLRSRAVDRPLSWTWANRHDLPKAVVLAAGEPEAVRDLRSAAAVALLAPDLKPLDPVLKGLNASAVATDPKTGLIAVGQYLRWAQLPMWVVLVDPATGRVARELSFTAGFARNPAGELKAAPDSVSALAFSPDGTRLFVGTRSSRVLRFDLDQPGNEPALEWKASTTALEQLALSPNGKTLYGLCRPERPVFVWSAETGKLVTKLEPSAEAAITSFAVLPSGDVVACEQHNLLRWTGRFKLVQTVPNPGALRLAASGAGLLVGNKTDLDVYDRDALTPIARFSTPELRNGVHEQYVKTIAVHPSGAFVATASGDQDRTLRVWQLASGRLVGTVSVPGTGPISVAWATDGNTLVATAHDQLARWAFQNPEAQRFACFSEHAIATAAFLPDGRVGAVTEAVGRSRTLLLGAPGGGVVPVALPERQGRVGIAPCPVRALAVGPKAPCLVTWEPLTAGRKPDAFSTDITSCARFDPAGGTLWAIVSSSEVYAFDPKTKEVRAHWSNAPARAFSGVDSLDALAVGRSVVAAGGRNGAITLLDPGTAACVTSFGAPGDPVLALALAPDETFLVAGTQNGKLRFVRTCDQKELPPVSAHPTGVTAVALNADGTLLATGGRDRTVRLWKRSGDGFELLFAVPDLNGPVRELKFHPTEGRLLVLVAQEQAVRVWDVERLKTQLGRFKLAW